MCCLVELPHAYEFCNLIISCTVAYMAVQEQLSTSTAYENLQAKACMHSELYPKGDLYGKGPLNKRCGLRAHISCK